MLDQEKSGRILHIIESLGVGGAEMLLKNTINALPDIQHTVVYLNPGENLKSEINVPNITFICLQHKGWKDLPRSVIVLKRILRQIRPDIVHSHLFISSLIARIAVPANVKLVTTLHSIFSKDAFEKNRKSLWLERLTLKKRHAIIAVSKYVLDDYIANVPFKGQGFVLYNFLPNHYFKKKDLPDNPVELKCLAVGNLKEAKNYKFLLKIFESVKSHNISLDVYGTGHLYDELQTIIEEKKIRVRLCGHVKDTTALPAYDLFIQASSHEGFGLTVIEAMASGIPVFISDIPVFKEITGGHGHFFPLSDMEESVKKLLLLAQDRSLRNRHINSGYEFVKANYTNSEYIRRLKNIYSTITQGSLVL